MNGVLNGFVLFLLLWFAIFGLTWHGTKYKMDVDTQRGIYFTEFPNSK